MKHFILIGSIVLSLMVIGLSACMNTIKGNGNVSEENRDVTQFTSIDVRGAYKIFIRQGEKEELAVRADENLQDNIHCKVDGKTLKIWNERNIINATELKLFITVKDLEKIEISGACKLKSKSEIKGDNLKIDISGAAKVDMQVDINQIDIDLSGGSESNLSGKAKDVSVDISGAGDLNALNLETDNFDIDISGAGRAKVFANKELNASISGAGKVEYKGNPQINQDISGAGSIEPLE